MKNYLFHYTSRQFAQDITISGKLKPRTGRKLFFTQDIYQTGAEAKKRLAIIGEAIEVVLIIPLYNFQNRELFPALENPGHAEPPIDSDYEYPEGWGCGTEIFTSNEINIKNSVCLSLGIP